MEANRSNGFEISTTAKFNQVTCLHVEGDKSVDSNFHPNKHVLQVTNLDPNAKEFYTLRESRQSVFDTSPLTIISHPEICEICENIGLSDATTYDINLNQNEDQLNSISPDILTELNSNYIDNYPHLSPSILTSLDSPITDSSFSLAEPELPSSEPNSHQVLQDLRVKNIHIIIFGHININSIRNKLDMLADLIKSKVDILLVSETKINDSFPRAQFQRTGFSTPYRMDRNGNGGGIILYVREDVPSKEITCYPNRGDIESIFVEINLYKKKWLIGGTYNPCKTMISNHINVLSKFMNHFAPLIIIIIIRLTCQFHLKWVARLLCLF